MRLLGLDIGSTSVKAVEISAAFGRFEVHEYHEVAVPLGGSAVEAASTLIHSLPKAPDKIITSLRSSRVTLRNLKLPTRDKKAIRSSVQFELEDDLPFEEDNVIYDYAVLNAHRNESQIHVATTLKSTLRDYIDHLFQSDIDPDFLTTEASAYRALLRKSSPTELDQNQPVMIVNIGHEHTTIYIQFQGIPLLCRETPWGGQEINIALSKRYNLSIEAAEKTKMDNGFVLPLSQLNSVSPDQYEFSNTVFQSMQELIRDIRQADLSCKNITGERVGTLYLTGGTSLLPGILATIGEEVKIPTQFLKSLSSLGGSGVSYSEQTDAKFALAAANALSCVHTEKPFLIHFRKKDFSKTKTSHSFDLNLVRTPIKILTFTTLLLIVLLYAEKSIYQNKLAATQKTLRSSVKAFFGSMSDSAIKNYVARPSLLKKDIDQELNKEREIANLLSPNPNSPIDILKDFSSLIPKNLVVDTMKYQVGSSSSTPYSAQVGADTKIELQFFVSDLESVNRLTSLLRPKIKEMKVTEPQETITPEGTKRLKVTFSGRFTGDPYGK